MLRDRSWLRGASQLLMPTSGHTLLPFTCELMWELQDAMHTTPFSAVTCVHTAQPRATSRPTPPSPSSCMYSHPAGLLSRNDDTGTQLPLMWMACMVQGWCRQGCKCTARQTQVMPRSAYLGSQPKGSLVRVLGSGHCGLVGGKGGGVDDHHVPSLRAGRLGVLTRVEMRFEGSRAPGMHNSAWSCWGCNMRGQGHRGAGGQSAHPFIHES
jgi:hypothetical protein